MNSFLVSIAIAIIIVLLRNQIKKSDYLATIITNVVIGYSILTALTLFV